MLLSQSKNPNCGCTPWRPVHRRVSNDHRKAVEAKWREDNADYLKGKYKQWSAANRPRVLSEKLAWKKANPAKVKAARDKFNAAHPERVAAGRAKRRAVKRGATVGNTRVIADWEKRWRSLRRVRCYWCGGMFAPKDCQTDHIFALAAGGAHEVGNLCVSCTGCNGRKNAKALPAWNAALVQPVLL